MEEIKIVLLAAPEFSTEVAEDVAGELSDILTEKVNSNINWTVEIMKDRFTSVAEDDVELLNGVIDILKTKNWDYAISLTDIPFFHEQEVVLAHVNYAYQFALVSLPALGWFVKNRVKEMVLQVIMDIYFKDENEVEKLPPKQVDELFTIGSVKEIEVNGKESKEIKYIFSSKIYGMLTILLGMTYDNQPWAIMPSLKRTIAVAFGSGAYAMIFPSIWILSNEYSYFRLITLMVLAIVGLGLWIIQGHNLWEKKSSYKNQKYRHLYNTTTISTILSAVSIFYLILFSLFLITTFILIDPNYYASQIDAVQSPKFINFLRLAWVAASVGTITGAVGVGLEDEENVRKTTYSYRQHERYHILKNKRQENEKE